MSLTVSSYIDFISQFIFICLDTGDIIGVYLHLLACKPAFMRATTQQYVGSSILDNEAVMQRRDSRIDSM